MRPIKFLQLLFLFSILTNVTSCKKHSHSLITKLPTPTPEKKILGPKTNLLPQKKYNPALTSPKNSIKTKVAPIYPDLKLLSGLDSSKISSLFGRPDFLRNDPPALYWQYKLENCTLDFFLYPDTINQNLYRVTFFESRGKQGTEDCLMGAIDRHNNAPRG